MKTNNRIWEIDFLRGIAFLCMVYDHVVFDLNSIFGVKTVQLDFIGDFSAILFMLLCGISTTLSKNCVKRGAIVFGAAMGLTAITFVIDLLFDTKLVIVFGILHMLGIAMMLSYFIKKLPIAVTAVLSAIIYALHFIVRNIRNAGNLFFLFGVHNAAFYSSDYYPLIPHLATVFIGIIIGKLLYSEKKSLFSFSVGKNPISFIGKHSLILYLTHQPVVMAILFVILKLSGII